MASPMAGSFLARDASLLQSHELFRLGREVWIYDKISSDRVYSSGGLFIATGASSTSQKTLTIVIKFDDNRKVREFAYHTSRF
ncbi:hypothetical protein Cpha266_0020 [Chlorobium phaeobacteroides DSM 266]|uniref:Uncharacterized protein n=1 Tax=Chlorobium phaeobacteroides (strain DSM 266 / SMG 266 / 2430) TaxID=290317 RepID=A1BCF8_CHLPD|nr:hypothetical protein Cpha266_0020 [Chlorobium phaeobacteroides DSM 266]